MKLRAWNFAGPMYRQTASENHGVLGLAESDGVDTREENRIQLGPKLTDLDLGSVGGTAANSNSAGIIARTSGGTEQFLYVGRGTIPAKIVYSTMALATTQPGALTERCTSIIVTKAPGGTAEISFGMLATNYETVTAVAATGAADTRASGGDMFRILGQGPDRVYGADGQTLQGNVLSGSVDMSTPAFATVATYARNDILPTGFAMNRDLVMWGTNRGPLMTYVQFEEFFPAAEVPADPLNCHAMRYIPFLGTVVPLKTQVRLWNGEYSQRVGPEAFNVSGSVQGQMTGLGNDANWAYGVIRNPNNSTTYLVAARPNQPGDWHGLPVSWYCIGSFSAVSELVIVPDDVAGERTNPLLIVGKADDIAYAILPRGQVASADANYIYQDATNQTATGTEVQPAEPETIEGFVMPRLSNLASGRTVTVKISYTDARGNSGTATFGAFDRSGRLEFDIPQGKLPSDLVAYKPQITLRSDTTASSPLVLGEEMLILRTHRTSEHNRRA